MTIAELLHRHGLDDITTALREHIVQQRWFGAKERSLERLEVIDAGELRVGDPTCILLVIRVHFSDGHSAVYSMPVGIRPTSHAMNEVNPRYRIGTIRHHGSDQVVYDAFADNDCSLVLFQLLHDQAVVPTVASELRATTQGMAEITDSQGIRLLTAEQTNSALSRDNTEFLKWIRRMDAGASIEQEMIEALTEGGFEAMAPPLGGLDYMRAGDVPSRLAFLHGFLPNATEGWALALTSLRDLYADVEDDSGMAREVAVSGVAQQGGSFLPESARLGEVTASMHRALASESLHGDTAPLPLDGEYLRRWAREMGEELDRLLTSDSQLLEPLRHQRERILSHYRLLESLDAGGLATRIHGDFHLGQVMRTDEGWVVLDFEGEPARPVAERRTRSSPLRDVAGMLRSFDYAAAAALAERLTPHHPRWNDLVVTGQAWAQANREAFWAAYCAGLKGTQVLPAGDAAVVLRQAFEVQKAVYEVSYELGHRPEWVDIPLNFLLRVTS